MLLHVPCQCPSWKSSLGRAILTFGKQNPKNHSQLKKLFWYHALTHGPKIFYFVLKYLIPSSVTRLGNLLDFGQLFKAFGKKWFAQISHILRQFFCKGVKICHFSSGIIFEQLLLIFGDFLLVTLIPSYLTTELQSLFS